MMRLILRLDWEQCGLRSMKNTQEHVPKNLCGNLQAQLLFEEEWYPPMEEEVEQSEEEMDQDNLQGTDMH